MKNQYEISDVVNTKDDIILVSLNRKPCDLSEVKENRYSSNLWCLPIKILDLNQKEFNEFTSDFYKHYDFLDDGKIGHWFKFHNKECVGVLQVRNIDTCESIYVDTSGYSYCRYVGEEVKSNG